MQIVPEQGLWKNIKNMIKPVAELLYATKSWNRRHFSSLYEKLTVANPKFSTYEISLVNRSFYILFTF
jgi:hypothetical protein